MSAESEAYRDEINELVDENERLEQQNAAFNDQHNVSGGIIKELKDKYATLERMYVERRDEAERLRGAFNLACFELEAYLGCCPIEQEKVPWDCDEKCTTAPTECGAQCWGDWFKHKQALATRSGDMARGEDKA